MLYQTRIYLLPWLPASLLFQAWFSLKKEIFLMPGQLRLDSWNLCHWVSVIALRLGYAWKEGISVNVARISPSVSECTILYGGALLNLIIQYLYISSNLSKYNRNTALGNSKLGLWVWTLSSWQLLYLALSLPHHVLNLWLDKGHPN